MNTIVKKAGALPHAALALLNLQFFRYLFASVAALAVDVGAFVAMLEASVNAMAASALSYSLGIIAHWFISSRTVFGDNVRAKGDGRTVQKALFVTSALAGLALTAIIVGLGDYLAIDPRIAKLAAIGVSFIVTWVLRKNIVFRAAA